MDSAVILAALFVYGINFAMYALFLSYVVYYFLNLKKKEHWKHISNFSMYSVMIFCAWNTFIFLKGNVGELEPLKLYTYVVCLIVYFLVNIFLISLFVNLVTKQKLYTIFNGMIKESLSAYFSTLMLSLVLTMLMENYDFFGLFLFMCIAVLISKSFQLLFKLYSSVAERAIKDQRTGLYNHGYFEEALETQLKQSKEDGAVFSVVVLDLDDFKKYNDTYGHLKGDQLLEFFGGLLKEHCEQKNIVIARYGGEEFTLILPGMADMEATVFVNRLRKTVNDTYFEGVELFPHGCLSFSAGVAQYTRDIYDKNQLVDRADQALYYAKAQGKNCVHSYSDDSLLQRAIDIEQDLREIEQQLSIFLSKDIYTFQHSKRVYRYAIEMCDVLPLNDAEKKTLVLGALFHDIGKLEIPRDILNKKGKLTPDEWEMVKKHVLWGKEIASTNEKFKELLPLIELHHERYDGKGYPRGLKGEEIPKLARILCIIDSFDAMTTERPYQKTKTFEEAIVELRLHAGKQFDPVYVEPFISIIKNKSGLHDDGEPLNSNAAG
ncbi:bifunctional diguanylate cyclase/phosphohydrolase [Paenibacillus thermotolerans]|uniref:bifunctional diguanylate cyclase/phosphohydrolase n=1 Tax=Paenibacillus thermotolerans TaxID=3027807 RepID=UPI00236803AF|nr:MULTISPECIES: diguanylate cyclase [unclassified Paenibacillus]